MGILLESNCDDSLRISSKSPEPHIASRKISRKVWQKQKRYCDQVQGKMTSDILTLDTYVLVKWTSFQEKHKVADV